MNVYELVFDNGCSYEDHYTKGMYYETYAEARKAMDEYDTSDDWLDPGAYLRINELELGTQARTRVYEKVLVKRRRFAINNPAELDALCVKLFGRA